MVVKTLLKMVFLELLYGNSEDRWVGWNHVV